MSAPDFKIELHVHLDCTPPFTEYEAWNYDDSTDCDGERAEWIARGTAPSPGAALDHAYAAYLDLQVERERAAVAGSPKEKQP